MKTEELEVLQRGEAWLDLLDETAGPVFRSIDRHGHIGRRLSDKAVALVVKRTAAAARLDPAELAGHSLRAGLATAAAAAASANGPSWPRRATAV